MIPVLQYNDAATLLNPDALHLVVQHCDLFTGMLLADDSRKEIIYWKLHQHAPEEAAAAIVTSLNSLPLPVTELKCCTVVDFGLDAALLPPEFDQKPGLAAPLLALTQGAKLPSQAVQCTSGAPVVVYATQKASLTTLQNALPAASNWQHLLGIMYRKPAAADTTISVTVLLQRFVLHVEHEGKRLLLQQYAYQAPEDILYRVLLAVQQLQLDAGQVAVVLTGFIAAGSAAEQLLYQYLPNVQWGDASHFNCAHKEHNMPAAHTLALADILLTCAS